MSTNLEEDLKKVLLAGIGAVATTAEKGKALVEEFIKKGELTVEQGKVLNEELKRKVGKACCGPVNVETMSDEEREELKRQLDEYEKSHAPEADGE